MNLRLSTYAKDKYTESDRAYRILTITFFINIDSVTSDFNLSSDTDLSKNNVCQQLNHMEELLKKARRLCRK
jgi:hypothetical protein